MLTASQRREPGRFFLIRFFAIPCRPSQVDKRGLASLQLWEVASPKLLPIVQARALLRQEYWRSGLGLKNWIDPRAGEGRPI